MVIVIVGQQEEIDWRQLLGTKGGRHEALRSKWRNGRSIVTKIRVGDNRQAILPQKKTGMTKPGETITIAMLVKPGADRLRRKNMIGWNDDIVATGRTSPEKTGPIAEIAAGGWATLWITKAAGRMMIRAPRNTAIAGTRTGRLRKMEETPRLWSVTGG